MNQPLQLDGKDSVAPSNQQLKYICHQCGHQTTHSLLLMKEKNLPLHSSFDTINLAVNQTRRRRKRRRRRLTLSSAEDSPEYERLSSSNGSQMQTLDVRIKL